jgi:hypothetical protein
MKVIIGFWSLLFVVSMVSCSKKPPEESIPPEKRMTLTIINDTGAVIDNVVFKPSGGDAYTQTCELPKGGSYTATLQKYDYYDIVLTDTKKHHYGKEGLRWIEGESNLTITEKDYVSQGLWDTIKKVIGL